MDARELHLERGYSSLYAYCTEALHMSEGAAYHRIKVARVAHKLPALLDRIRLGELHLSGAVLLSPKLTPENHEELLDLARHKSKRAIEELLADRAPKPNAPALVRRLPDPAPSPVPDPRPLSTAGVQAPSTSAAPTPHPTPAPRTRPPEPLGQQRYKIQFTATREMCGKLREAQALLRNQVPDGDLAEIFARALTLLVKEARRKKFAEVASPSSAGSSRTDRRVTRHIPAEIRRTVEARDGGRCAFVAANGKRCGSRDFLEFHHKEPWGHAKLHSVGNIELRCRAHNRHAAIQDFGADYMAGFRKPGRSRLSPGTVELGGDDGREGID